METPVNIIIELEEGLSLVLAHAEVGKAALTQYANYKP